MVKLIPLHVYYVAPECFCGTRGRIYCAHCNAYLCIEDCFRKYHTLTVIIIVLIRGAKNILTCIVMLTIISGIILMSVPNLVLLSNKFTFGYAFKILSPDASCQRATTNFVMASYVQSRVNPELVIASIIAIAIPVFLRLHYYSISTK